VSSENSHSTHSGEWDKSTGRPTYDPGMPARTQPALYTSTGIDGAEASPPSRRPCRRLYRRGLPHRARLICAMNAAVLATPELAGTIAAA
jgi:hypothetical protein